MNLIYYFVTTAAVIALLPTDPTMIDVSLGILIMLMCVIGNANSFKAGREEGRQLTYDMFAEAMHERGIKSITFRQSKEQ